MNAKSITQNQMAKIIRPENRTDMRKPLSTILSERRRDAMMANEMKIIMSEFKLHYEPGVVSRIADYRRELRLAQQ